MHEVSRTCTILLINGYFQILAAAYHGSDKEGRPLYIQLSGTMDVERLVSVCEQLCH